MEASTTLAPRDPAALKAVAHSQSDVLHDVLALLDAAAGRINDATPSAAVDRKAADDMHHTWRLVLMAREKVGATISAFDPHI
jgi:hypothetical protein